jgi:hypothetical protein
MCRRIKEKRKKLIDLMARAQTGALVDARIAFLLILAQPATRLRRETILRSAVMSFDE